MLRYVLFSCASACLLILVPAAHADLIIDFADGDSFDGDGATALADSTDQAGPFDLSAGVPVVLTTRLINGTDFSTTANILDTNDFKLGIDTAGVAGGEKNNWNNGESWTFDWSGETLFSGIDFGGFDPGDVFEVQSNSFVGFIPANALGAGVSFSSATGTFTFDGSASNDDFTVSDIGGDAIVVAAGEDITITFTGDQATLQSFTFGATAIPEPTGAAILLVSMMIGLASTRTFRKRTISA